MLLGDFKRACCQKETGHCEMSDALLIDVIQFGDGVDLPADPNDCATMHCTEDSFVGLATANNSKADGPGFHITFAACSVSHNRNYKSSNHC